MVNVKKKPTSIKIYPKKHDTEYYSSIFPPDFQLITHELCDWDAIVTNSVFYEVILSANPCNFPMLIAQ